MDSSEEPELEIISNSGEHENSRELQWR